MYAVFDKRDDFIGFVKEIPPTPHKEYFLYEVKEKLDYSLYSAYLTEDGVRLYCDGYKVLAAIASMGLIRRIIKAFNKFRGMI